MKIRRAIPEDIPAIITLWENAGLLIRPTGRDHPDNLAIQMNKSNMWVLLAEENAKLIGAVLVTHDSRKGWINRLATLPSERRKGVGMKLLDAAEQSLLEINIEIFTALISKDNIPSRTLFEKANYRYWDDITYYSKRSRDDI